MALESQEFEGVILKTRFSSPKALCSCVTSGHVEEPLLDGLKLVSQSMGSQAMTLARAGVQFKTQLLQVS